MENEIELKEIFSIIKRRLWMIFLITLIFTGVGYTYKIFNTPTPVYQASARVIIDANNDYKSTLMVVVRDSTILDKVIGEMGLPLTSEELARQVRVDSVENTQVVRISVIDKDPILAADIANTISSVFQREIVQLVNFNGVTKLSEARVDMNQINVQNNTIIYITFVLGVMVGVGYVFLLHALDNTVRDEIDIEELMGLPVLGVVSTISKKNLKMEKYSRKKLRTRGDTVEVN